MDTQNRCCQEKIRRKPCEKDPCKPDVCGCDTFLGSECIIYNGRGFSYIDLPKSSNVTSILEWIDKSLQNLANGVMSFRNLGDGVPVFKDRSLEGYYDFRTLKSKNENTLVIDKSDTLVNLEVAEPILDAEDGGVIILYLKTKLGEKKEVSRITLRNLQTDDYYINNVSISNDNYLVFSYNKSKPPIKVSVAEFLKNFHTTNLVLQGTKLILTRNGNLPDLSVDLSSLRTTDTYVTGLALQNSTLTLSQNGRSDISVNLSSVEGRDTYVETLTLQDSTLVLTQNNGRAALSVNLGSAFPSVDTYVTGLKLSNNVLTLTQNNNSNFTVNLGSISSDNNYVTEVNFDVGTYNLNIKRKGLSDLNLDLGDLRIQQPDFAEDRSTERSYIKNKNKYKEISSDYTISPFDNNTNVYINNGTQNVIINVPSAHTLTSILEQDNAFFVSFTQVGTGKVTFNGYNLLPSGKKAEIEGSGHVAAIEATRNTTFLYGNLKQA